MEDKTQNYCGDCLHFDNEDMVGGGICYLYNFGTQCDSKACEEWEKDENFIERNEQ